MVNLKLILKAQELFVEQIIKDVRRNHFSWEVLEYVNNRYVQVEIEHNDMSVWNKDKYEKYLEVCAEKHDFCEIRFHRGYVYKYVNVHNKMELDHDWNDEEDDWEVDRDCYEQFERKEFECVPEYKRFGSCAGENVKNEKK